MAAVYVLSGVAVLLILDLAWNYAAPERFRFLDVLERADLQGFLSSGILGGLLASGAGRLASMQQKR